MAMADLSANALRRYDILDTPAEETFDSITRLAAHACGTPMAAINFPDGPRFWLKSNVGLGVTEIPREIGLCAITLEKRDLVVVPDARQDPRFAKNPLVVGQPGIRFYAAMPLLSPDGHALGTLCVLDTIPRELSSEQADALRTLAQQVVTILELRCNLAEVRHTAAQRDRSETDRKHIEARIRAYLENTPGIPWEANAETGDLLFVGAQAVTLLGVPAEEWLRPGFGDRHLHPEDRDWVRQVYRAGLADGRQHEIEFRMLKADGSTAWVHSRYLRLPPDANPPRIVGLICDVTERHRMEQALRDSEARFRRLVETTRAIPYEVDAVTWRVTYAGPQAARILGHPVEDWYQDGFLADRTHPEDRDRVFRRRIDAAARGEDHELEYRMTAADGRAVWVRDLATVSAPEGGPRTLHGLLIDVTDRRHAEEALRESERRYRILFNGLEDMVFLTNVTPEGPGRFLDVNDAACRRLGYAREEFLQLTPFDIHRAEARDGMRGLMEPLQREGHVLWEDEIITRAGETIPVELHIQLAELNGQPVGIAVGRDTSERKHAEEALRNANRRLEEALAELQRTQQQVIQQERLRALGTMASGIAHDFNNALAPILGFSELLLLRPELVGPDEKSRRYLDLIHTAAQDAGAVVRRLREFYRSRDADDPAGPVHVNSLIREVVSLTQPTWKGQAQASGRTIDVQADLSPLPLLAASEPELKEVLTNLIFNAVDAMPKGGTITLRTRLEEDHVVIEVSDTGVGMTDEVRHRCLEPFFTTKGPQGTGLGLAVAYGIVRRQGGALDIRSAPGEGTIVTLRLPLGAPEATPTASPPAPTAERPLNILVIDDEPLVREALAAHLAADGHRVALAADGQDGWTKFRSGVFDLVITDRAMPHTSGDRLAAAIKLCAPSTPVLLLTGFGDMMEAVGERPPGVDRILSKPVSRADLRRAISQLISAPSPS